MLVKEPLAFNVMSQSRLSHWISTHMDDMEVNTICVSLTKSRMGDAWRQMSIPIDDEERKDLLSWFKHGWVSQSRH